MRPMNESSSIFMWQDTNFLHPTERKINKFLALDEGWHYGEGVPISKTIIQRAIQLNREAIRRAFYETDAFPGVNGEIMFTIYYGKHYLEFIIEPDKSVTASHELEDEEISYQEGLSFQEAKSKIEEFRKELWRESESSTEHIMIEKKEDLPASHSEIQGRMPPVYQSSAQSVYNLPEKLSATTSENIISKLQAILQFSGASQPIYYHLIIG